MEDISACVAKITDRKGTVHTLDLHEYMTLYSALPSTSDGFKYWDAKNHSIGPKFAVGMFERLNILMKASPCTIKLDLYGNPLSELSDECWNTIVQVTLVCLQKMKSFCSQGWKPVHPSSTLFAGEMMNHSSN